eukprot:XP_011679249.1 PREDICTED: poly(U)-specific endoribonuclease [Strongylocentrotus purpuratus]
MKTVGIIALCLLACVLQTYAAGSCSNRCGSNNNIYDCQCNSQCINYQDCCADYFIKCKGVDKLYESDLTALAGDLWNQDVNRLSSSQYTINKQTKLSDYDPAVDRSSSKFFTSVKTSNLKGTWPSFQNLLNNYVIKTGTSEQVSSGEEAEMDTFMNKIMATSVMTTTYELLNEKGYFDDKASFKKYVEGVWFNLYTRSSGRLDSSAFEHTFVGEIKNSAVSGFHNWYQFYLMEKTGRLNYYGYVEEANPNLILLQFSVDNYVKKLSSLMHGVSPEFELALFTTCFVSNPGSSCSFKLQGSTVRIQTYDYNGGYIGSAFFNV